MAFAPLKQQPNWNSLVAPMVYNPPQLKKSWQPCCLGNVNWMTRDSPVCNSFPCCIGQFCRGCVLPCLNKKKQMISQPDEWFVRMLQAAKPGCPERFQGIWWMKDNNVPEELVTMSDGLWRPGPEPGQMTAEMMMYKNWTYGGTSAFGSILACLEATEKLKSTWTWDGGQWIWIGGASFIYLLEEGDVLRRPDGSVPAYTPGVDMMRVTWSGSSPEDMDTSKPFFQYLVRRVASLDPAGRLVKTDAYNELLDRTRRPNVPGACCNYGLCNIPVDSYEEIFMPISDECYVEFH